MIEYVKLQNPIRPNHHYQSLYNQRSIENYYIDQIKENSRPMYSWPKLRSQMLK